MQIQPHIRDIITKHWTCQQYQRRCCIAIRNTKQHSIPTKYILAVSGIWIVLWQESYSKIYPFGGGGLKFSLYSTDVVAFCIASLVYQLPTSLQLPWFEHSLWKKTHVRKSTSHPFHTKVPKTLKKSEPTTIHRHPQVQRHQSSPLPQHLALPSSSRPQECSPPAVTAMAGPRPAVGRHWPFPITAPHMGLFKGRAWCPQKLLKTSSNVFHHEDWGIGPSCMASPPNSHLVVTLDHYPSCWIEKQKCMLETSQSTIGYMSIVIVDGLYCHHFVEGFSN